MFPLWIAYHRDHVFLGDDAYITLTYAKNLAKGNGFVFNQPPPTLGSSSPLFVLIIAGLSILMPQANIPTITIFFTSVCWVGMLWCFYFYRKSWDLTKWPAMIICLLMSATMLVTLAGLESYLFSFLLILSISLFYRGSFFGAGVTVGLLFLTRGEGILVLLIMVLASMCLEWSKLRKFLNSIPKNTFHLLIGFIFIFISWFFYAYYTFGYILPNTLRTKIAQGETGLWRSFPDVLILDWIPNWSKQLTFEPLSILNLWWILVLTGLCFVIIQKRKWLFLLFWMVIYICGYSLLNIPGYGWYQIPILFVLQLFAALGLIKYIELLSNIKKFKILGRLALFILIILIIFNFGKSTINAVDILDDKKGKCYFELAKWIRENTQPIESLAYIEIGYLGFYTENTIIDLAGLVTPNIASHIATKDFAWGFWHYKPDYYIYWLPFDWALAEIRANPKFNQQYQIIAKLPGPSKADIVVFKRIIF